MTKFIVKAENGKEFEYDTRPEADEHVKKIADDFDMDAEVVPKTESDGGQVVAQQSHDEIDEEGTSVKDVEAGFDNMEPEQEAPTPEPVDTHGLPDEPNLSEDPFAWMPGDFVDTIDGTPTINRRGYAALGRKFGISAPEIDVEVGPEDTGHEYCRVRALVRDDDGREFVNHGSAHVDRGDDATLLLEMATTRARKRALAGATGIGLIAIEELKNEL
ncbi:RecT-like DNA single-strand annealing protein [Haloferax tailed virus 1]|uniref:RecT-like DNA single-strand annealing protein n=1 Tax=Haloferax tailed virus 1 TaxID=2507575 RepID=A0A410N6X7_HFTV1|nr:RecT-like DNA single-strand annealing protein [Haloferax tailed virus 1]QAS68883.1 RecT-like DNA single-strand annealing protein [Haloferax tailed virus 1]